MKRLLFLAHYFPPIGGAGVQRSVKFVKHLPAFGIEPIIFTGPSEAQGRWQPEDASLDSELPPGLEVHRIQGSPPTQTTRASRLLGTTSPFGKWLSEGLLRLSETLDAAPDVLLVSLAPYEALAPALSMARKWGCPIVADLRDPWALDEVRIYPSSWHRQREQAQMQRLLGQCDAVIWNCPEAHAAGRDLLGEAGSQRQHCIPNGYDEDDFAGLRPRAPDGRLRIVHSGYLHAELGLRHRARGRLQRLLGGELSPVDFLTRSHVFLLKALERLQREQPQLAGSIDLHLYGVLSPSDTRIAQESSFKSIHLHGYTPHSGLVRALVESDILFLPMHDLTQGRRARIVPGKTYEYLRAGAPILAAVPPGDARDFVIAAEAGHCVPPAGSDEMVDAIASAAEKPEKRSSPVREAIARFERRRLTAELASILDQVLGGSSPITPRI